MPATTLLEQLTSKDSQRIWEAACTINKLWDKTVLLELAQHLADIKKQTHAIALGGFFLSNAYHLEHALERLEYVGNNPEACLCYFYPKNLFYQPEKEAEAGHIHIDSCEDFPEVWGSHWQVHCQHCGQQFKIHDGESHYRWWQWERVH